MALNTLELEFRRPRRRNTLVRKLLIRSYIALLDSVSRQSRSRLQIYFTLQFYCLPSLRNQYRCLKKSNIASDIGCTEPQLQMSLQPQPKIKAYLV